MTPPEGGDGQRGAYWNRDHELLRRTAETTNDHSEWLTDMGVEAMGRDRRRLFPGMADAAWDRRRADRKSHQRMALLAAGFAGLGGLLSQPLADLLHHFGL